MIIFIRADGGNYIGLGHIMRMIVLAKELSISNKVFFLCRNSNFNNGKFQSGIEKIKENNLSVIEISEENMLDDIIKIQRKCKAKLIITDSYDVNEEYFIELKKHFILTGYVDDVNKFKMDVDILINQNIDALYMEYRKTTKDKTKLFLGTKYCMIRDEFRKAASEKIIKDEVQDILITLGGMDNNHNTKKILNIIKECNKNIHIVLGSAFDKTLISDIDYLSKKCPNIYLYENANMSELMKKCDVAIAACGSTLYELCIMKIPTIGLIIADNQEHVAKIMKEKELVLDIFNIEKLNEFELMRSLNKLINNKSIRARIINNQRNIVNINGARNLANEITKLLNE